MVLTNRKYLRTAISIVLLAVFFVSFLSLTQMNMTTGPDGQTSSSDCPFMPGMASLCHMNPLEHIAAWQSMFTAVPNQQDTLMMILLFLASLIAGILLIRKVLYPPKISDAYSRAIHHKAQACVVSPLQELFSSGILHPKIF